MAKARKKFEPNDNNLAIAYYHFSSHSHNEASIDQQRETAQRYASDKGYHDNHKEYAAAAISGTTSDKPQYQLMLSEINKMRPAALILWKTPNRLGSDKYELVDAKRRIHAQRRRCRRNGLRTPCAWSFRICLPTPRTSHP